MLTLMTWLSDICHVPPLQGLPPPPQCAFWEDVSMFSPHYAVHSPLLCFSSLSWVSTQRNHNLFGILLPGRFFSFPLFYQLIHSFYYISSDSWIFIPVFWVVSQYYLFILLLTLFQVWTLDYWEFFELDIIIPLWLLPSMFLLGFFFGGGAVWGECFLTFWHYLMTQTHLIYFLPPIIGVAIFFPKESDLFSLL